MEGGSPPSKTAGQHHFRAYSLPPGSGNYCSGFPLFTLCGEELKDRQSFIYPSISPSTQPKVNTLSRA